MTPSDGGSAPGSPGSTYCESPLEGPGQVVTYAGALTPRSAPSTPAVPQTPKSVHFASEKSVLESVVVFSKGARPRSLSNPGGYDTETETEGYDSTAGSGRYPFPAMPKNEIVPLLDEAASSEVPMKRALGSNGYGVSDERHYVYLETIMLPGTRPPTLRGSSELHTFPFLTMAFFGPPFSCLFPLLFPSPVPAAIIAWEVLPHPRLPVCLTPSSPKAFPPPAIPYLSYHSFSFLTEFFYMFHHWLLTGSFLFFN